MDGVPALRNPLLALVSEPLPMSRVALQRRRDVDGIVLVVDDRVVDASLWDEDREVMDRMWGGHIAALEWWMGQDAPDDDAWTTKLVWDPDG